MPEFGDKLKQFKFMLLYGSHALRISVSMVNILIGFTNIELW